MAAVAHLPATDQRLAIYKRAQSEDPQCQLVLQYCQDGWPSEQDVDPSVRAYWDVQGELTVGDGLLLHGHRIVVPKALQKETLGKLHSGQQGMVRCRLRAKSSVWWPGLNKQLTDFVHNCPECARMARAKKEPLLPTPLPDYPWQIIATDLFTLSGNDYLVVVDYFSCYLESIQLRSTTSKTIINTLKSLFARHGIPEIVRSDNGPQFSSREFAEFAKTFQFKHVTSSPHYPASNGQAERTVQTIKNLLKKADDPFLHSSRTDQSHSHCVEGRQQSYLWAGTSAQHSPRPLTASPPIGHTSQSLDESNIPSGKNRKRTMTVDIKPEIYQKYQRTLKSG